MKEALEHPALIHMTSVFLVHNRTWIEGSNHPAKSLYKKYKQLTPWAEEPDLPDCRSIKKIITDRIIDLTPRKIMLPIASIFYNKIRTRSIRHNMDKYSQIKN